MDPCLKAINENQRTRVSALEELPKESATSTLLPARLILVTKPNVHGGLARKKARIVICGNFQDVHTG